jgi:hypothetical protein
MSLSHSVHFCPACLLPIEKPGECIRCALIGALTAADCLKNGRELPDLEHLSPHESRWLAQSTPLAAHRECQAA